MKKEVVLLALILALSALPNQAPIIGIFTQSDTSDEPVNGKKTSHSNAVSNYTYIAASYIKFVEMSGAQVVPVYAYSNKSYFDELLPKLNGILFPGGDVDIDIKKKWTENADYVLKWAMAQNNKGNVFPIWGTCLGMQLIAYLTSGYDAAAIAPVRGQTAMRNTLEIESNSYLFSDISENLNYQLQNGQGILYFNHHFAVRTEYFQGNKLLKDFWNVEAYTTSPFNEQFLSVFSAKKYPFYGVQFHPEKNLFEWKVYADRSSAGAEIVQIFSNKFIEQARKSQNKFTNPDEFKKLSIYNYKTQLSTMSFVLTYVFNEVNGVQNTTALPSLAKA